MELQKLRYFYTVAQYGHITRAAEHIGIVQPALTQAIKSLEQELGVPLLKKQGRSIVLTEYGQYLQKRLHTLLPEIDRIPGELEQLRSRINKTIKLNIQAASSLVVSAIVSYRKENPDALFDFEQNTQQTDCDIVIRTNGSSNKPNRPYEERCIKEERIYLAVPKVSPYAKLSSIDLRTLKDEGFVMLSSSRQFGNICGKFCAIAGFFPKILFESDSPSAVQSIIGTGSGIAFWPEYSWGKVNNENVVLLPISYPKCQRELIIERFDRLPRSEYAAEFYDHLLDHIVSF